MPLTRKRAERKEDKESNLYLRRKPSLKKKAVKSLLNIMKKRSEPMMDFCEVFDTEEEAIAA